MGQIFAGKYLVAAACALIGVLGWLGFSSNVFASSEVIIAVTVSEVLRVEINSSSDDASDLSVSVSTNSSDGYTLIMGDTHNTSDSVVIAESSGPTNLDQISLTLSDYGNYSPNSVIFTAIPK